MSLRSDLPGNAPPFGWEPLTPYAQNLVVRLWKGERATATDTKTVRRMLAWRISADDCWRLALPEQVEATRRFGGMAPYVGDATDIDGCLAQAVLVLDEQSLPLELEIVRLDSAPLMSAPESLIFTLVPE